MTEEKEDPNARDKFIIGQYPNEFECASKIDEIEIDDRYSYENTFLNLDEEIQFIFGGNDSLLKRCENNINDFNNINTTNNFNDIDNSFNFVISNNSENKIIIQFKNPR